MARQVFFPNPNNKPVGFSPSTRVGNVIFVSGQVSADANGDLVGEGDGRAQAERCFGCDVLNDETKVILINFLAWDFTFINLTENAVPFSHSLDLPKLFHDSNCFDFNKVLWPNQGSYYHRAASGAILWKYLVTN